jgi:peptide/nickel transport system permease protein
MVDKKLQNPARKKTKFMIVLETMMKNRIALIGMIIMAVLILIAICAPFLAPYGYDEMNTAQRLQGPSLQHLFGTDKMGRDILSRMMYGAKYSLGLGFLSVAISTVIGILLGALAGFYSGAVDTAIMRIMDIVSAIPNMLLAIVVAAVLGTGFVNTALALAVSSIPGSVRLTRASILSVRKSEYVEAAGCINCSDSRIIMKHVLPNTLSPMIVNVTLSVAMTILSAAGLSFIGLGIQPPAPEWGAMLAAGRDYMRDYPYMVLCPGLVIMITVLSLNMIGDALRDALDPKLKK